MPLASASTVMPVRFFLGFWSGMHASGCLDDCDGNYNYWCKVGHHTLCLCSDARSAEVSHLIKWHSGPCSRWVPRQAPSTVVVNPPWGLRLLNDDENAESDQSFRGTLNGLALSTAAFRVPFDVQTGAHCHMGKFLLCRITLQQGVLFVCGMCNA